MKVTTLAAMIAQTKRALRAGLLVTPSVIKAEFADILRGPRRFRDPAESKPRLADHSFLAGIGVI